MNPGGRHDHPSLSAAGAHPHHQPIPGPRRGAPGDRWFANLTNANTRRAYRKDLDDLMAFAGLRHPEQFRHVTRAHVIAWREKLVSQGLANDTIRRKLAALSSLYA